jgi:hypothetical protein
MLGGNLSYEEKQALELEILMPIVNKLIESVLEAGGNYWDCESIAISVVNTALTAKRKEIILSAYKRFQDKKGLPHEL